MTRNLEAFKPIEEGTVRMYHCGPTVYQRPHIGNYRAFLFADLLRRLFDQRGLQVTQVMNLTDVGHLVDDADDGEDKLEVQARKEKIDPWQLVQEVSKQFFADLEALQVRPAHHYPRATEHIPEMIQIVNQLLERGHAYQVGANVYFDVHSFERYGQLSGNRIEDLEAGARLEVNDEKRHPSDFALWKSDPQHIMKWESEFGPDGFPGWHVECSAMAMKYLGESFDIHTGGEDNIFPHHECEIAQSEGATGAPFVNLWMHTRFLRVDGGKMSKSLGNVYSLDDLIEKGFEVLDFRFLVLKAHYRGSLNFTWEALRSAAEARKGLMDFRGRLTAACSQEEGGEGGIETVLKARTEFQAAISEDLNTSAALAAVFDLRNYFLKEGLSSEASKRALDFLLEVDDLLGLFPNTAESSSGLTDAEIDALVVARTQARTEKDWARADEIRDQLSQAKIVLEDGPDGVHWHRG
jgi:cysteinyl-tRNA synthetase